MSRLKPKLQPNPTAVTIFLDQAIEKHNRLIKDNPDANPTFIVAVALKAKEARVPLMRLREIANNTKNPPSWRNVAAYIIDSCRV